MAFQGQGAAGAVAVAERESGFNAQAINPSGGVAGWLQWSGWGNTINGNRISSEGSIKSGDMSTLTAVNEFKLLDYELNGSKNSTRMSVGKATDPQQAALDWSVLYEGVSLADGQTKESEIKANALKWYTSLMVKIYLQVLKMQLMTVQIIIRIIAIKKQIAAVMQDLELGNKSKAIFLWEHITSN